MRTEELVGRTGQKVGSQRDYIDQPMRNRVDRIDKYQRPDSLGGSDYRLNGVYGSHGVGR
jgi:hypothetical protein